MKANMFLIDWIVAAVWVSLFGLGLSTSVIILFPVTLIFGILNYTHSKKILRIVLLDMNLMMASVIGIMLNAFLFINFVYADPETVSMMIVLIFFSLIYITLIMVFSMIALESGRKKRRRIVNSLAEGEESRAERRLARLEEKAEEEEASYAFSGRDSFLRPLSGMRDAEELPEEEPEEDGGEEEPEEAGPKFRVIVKDKK
ncbi:MAG: hypothetical protein K6F35_08705 [Lachnospiraceae bacterium]|nr:hypothetical protein [Lachnospiraceae bacterium]